MKKKCPLCNRLIEITDQQTLSIAEMKCPKCDGELLVFNSYKLRLEGKNHIRAKCPSCEKHFLHEISRNCVKTKAFSHFHQICPICETSVVISGILCNDGQGSIFEANIDTFSAFPSAYYIIAVKSPFNHILGETFSNVRAAKSELKRLLVLPDDRDLRKTKRHNDYKTVAESIHSYVVSSPGDVKKFLPTGFSIVYTSCNLLAKTEKRGSFLCLLKTLVALTNAVKDVCGKAAITASVIDDIGNIPSEIPYKWSEALRSCRSLPGYDMFDPLYKASVFMDFEKLAGFQAERHLYKMPDETEIIKVFKEDTWYKDFGCIHPVKIIDYAAKNTVSVDVVVSILENAGILIFEIKKEAIDWNDYEDQFHTLKLKEDALGFPAGRSIRQAIGNESLAWKNTRKVVLEKEKYTCQICGYHTDETKYLHVHEVWGEGPEQDVLCLKDIQLLCNRCHDCKHIGQFLMRNPTNPEPYDRMIMHMAKVNNCSPEVVYAYHKYRIEQIQKRHKEKILQCGAGEDRPRVSAVKYTINANVTNREELLAALEKKGLVYHSK